MPLIKKLTVTSDWLRGSSPCFIFASLFWSTPALARDDFFNLPLEDLLKIKITSASREDIERSGARTIPASPTSQAPSP